MEGINWISVFVGALVPMLMGFIWYHPKFFGTAWMHSLGFREEDLQGGNMAVIFGVSYIMSALAAYLISEMMSFHPEELADFVHGMYHAGKFGILAAVPVLVTNSLFEKRTWTNILINAAYWIVTFCLMGGVIALFY